MDADVSSRYRSRILREMNANRDNPFNSPPSSTGSHGTVSPTLTSVLSDLDGESTRKLNAEIARVTSKKYQVNWEAAHRKWPEFYDMPSRRVGSKENARPTPFASRFNDDSTQDPWCGSNRTRAEMQPSVQNESDTSTMLSGKDSRAARLANFQHRSPLSGPHAETPTQPRSHPNTGRRSSAADMLKKLRAVSASPDGAPPVPKHTSQRRSSHSILGSSPTLQASSNKQFPISPGNGSTVRSFCMPDISYLGDFVSGTLRFNGKVKNGVPILVKHGRVVDLATKQPPNNHADVDGLEIPEDEERIFVSMDMIREEIVALQEHHDDVQRYAEQLQSEVDRLQLQIKQLKARRSADSGSGSDPVGPMYEQLLAEKKRLEDKVAELQRLLDEANQKLADEGKAKDALAVERDRAVKKLQEACHEINDLLDKLDSKDQQLRDARKQLDTTLKSKDVNSTLRIEMETLRQTHETAVSESESLRHTIETLRQEHQAQKEEIESLRADSVSLRREQESLITENRSLRSNARTLMTEVEGFRDTANNARGELEEAREEVEALQQDLISAEQEKASFKEDNESLVRHNEKYFNENKILRRENSGFERSLHDLHEENLQLKGEVEFLKQQLDHCRPVGRDDDLEEEENMTSGFIIPDITLQRKKDRHNDATEDGLTVTDPLPMPDITVDEGMTQEDKSMDIRETIEKDDSITPANAKSKRTKGGRDVSQKVAFSVPENNNTTTTTRESRAKPNVAAKRRNAVPRDATNNDYAVPLNFTLDQDDTGYQSTEPTQTHTHTQTQTQTQTHSLALNMKPQTINSTIRSQQKSTVNSDSKRVHSRNGHRAAGAASHKYVSADNTVDTMASRLSRNACPALSDRARRVLDGLCEHSCKNCVVCARIVSHRGTVSAAELSGGKKKIAVARPVPVTDRMAADLDEGVALEDPTMRPSQPPGHALAMVIKGLEDEAAHMSMELARLQAMYAEADKSRGKKGRKDLAGEIRMMLRRLEVKNDQVYALYDVLEGQKAAGQAMSEEELEMTIFSITGMSVRDVSENITWNGIQG